MVDADKPIIDNSEVQELKERVRELEGIVEYLTQDNEFLRDTLAKASKIFARRPVVLPDTPPSAEGSSEILELPKGRSKPFKPTS